MMKRRFLSLITCLMMLSANQMVCAQSKQLVKVASNDCGEPGKQPFLIKGENYTMATSLGGNKEALSCNFGDKVIYAFDKMDIQADYRLELVYLSDGDRRQQIVVDGNVLQEPITLVAGKEQRYTIDLPKKAYAYGQLVLIFEKLSGPNAIVSEITLYSSNPKELIAFSGQKKLDLVNIQTYKIDTTVCAEKVLPRYTPLPHTTVGSYQPKLSLNGSWLFNPKPTANFFAEEMITGWSSIVVPGEWSMQGFKVDSAAYAAYQRNFTLPVDWSGQCVKLRFEGVMSECVVYINGKEVTQHEGGMTAFEIDATPFLIEGSNRLALKVKSECEADKLGSLTQYAAHQLGGITRDVTLFAVPKVHVADLRVVTDLDAQYNDATLKLFVKVINEGTQVAKNNFVRVTLDGNDALIEQQLGDLAPGAVWSGWIETQVKSPRLWNDEHPNLYELNLELRATGVTSEVVKKRIGFREIEVKGNQMLVNGKAIKLRGVCRHEAHPLMGRVLNDELWLKDAQLYREANCNFIRTSHYPPSQAFIDRCDELGLFVEVEAPVCWVGHHANENWTKENYQEPHYYKYILQANMETIQFYRNHPSVILWSIANESYWNREFAQVLEYVKKADPSRPNAFHDQAYGGFNNQGSTASVANIHYPGPDGPKAVETFDRPITFGEYCHLNVYNRTELVTDPGVRSDWAMALAPMWEGMYNTQAVLGGSIWSGIDDIFQLPDGSAVGYGAWGPIDGWRRTKPEYWDMKKIFSPVKLLTTHLTPGSPFTIELENRYTFTNMNEVKVYYRCGNENGVTSFALKPGAKGTFTLPVISTTNETALYIAFHDPRGFVADEYLLPIGEQKQNKWDELSDQSTKLKTAKEEYIITGRGFRCVVSRTTGQLLRFEREGKELMTGGPWLMALPLTGGGCYPNHNANTPPFNDMCLEWQLVSCEAVEQPNGVLINVKGKYKEFEGGYSLLVNASGKVTAEYQFKALEDVNPRQWGLVFEAPRRFETTFWRREGMWSVYPEDHISRPTGEAKLFYSGLPVEENPRVEPTWSWSHDFNGLGSNDFRSTRRNIYYAGLQDKDENRVVVLSNGQQHFRSWLAKDAIRFLIADFVTAGNEMFLGSHYAPYRKPIKVGDEIKGVVVLQGELPIK